VSGERNTPHIEHYPVVEKSEFVVGKSNETAGVKLEEDLDTFAAEMPADTAAIIVDPVLDLIRAKAIEETAVRAVMVRMNMLDHSDKACCSATPLENASACRIYETRNPSISCFAGSAGKNCIHAKSQQRNYMFPRCLGLLLVFSLRLVSVFRN